MASSIPYMPRCAACGRPLDRPTQQPRLDGDILCLPCYEDAIEELARARTDDNKPVFQPKEA